MKLMAILDPTEDQQFALNRAIKLAVDTDAHIQAFCCTYLKTSEMDQYESRREAKHEEIQRSREWLKEIINQVSVEQSVSISKEVCWNEFWYRAALFAAVKLESDIIVKSTYHHSRARRWLSETSDYHFIRNSSCPVLLTSREDDWLNGRILAAINMVDEEAEHGLLNNYIVKSAKQIARATHSELHLVCAYRQDSSLENLMDEDSQDPQGWMGDLYGVPSNQVHLVKGSPQNVILDGIDQTKADLLVMGSIARKSLTGAILGNTAERIIDQTPVDVMVVS